MVVVGGAGGGSSSEGRAEENARRGAPGLVVAQRPMDRTDGRTMVFLEIQEPLHAKRMLGCNLLARLLEQS